MNEGRTEQSTVHVNAKVSSLIQCAHVVVPEPFAFRTRTATEVAFLARPHVLDMTVPGMVAAKDASQRSENAINTCSYICVNTSSTCIK